MKQRDRLGNLVTITASCSQIVREAILMPRVEEVEEHGVLIFA